MNRELKTAAATTPRADAAKTPRRATAPTKPATAPPPGRPRVTPRRGTVLCNEPSYEKPPCVIPADCKTPDAKVDPSTTVLDLGFPYVDIIQRQDAQKVRRNRVGYTTLEKEQTWWRKPNTPKSMGKARKKTHGHGAMTAAGFSTFNLNVAVDKAEAYYQRKLKENPVNTAVLKDYGCWLHAQDRLIEAERMFKKALLLERRDVSVICAYAALLWESGKQSRAEDMFRMALTFEPQHLQSLLDYGLVLFSKGDFIASLQKFRKAAEVDPSNEQALLGVAVALEKVGRTENDEIDGLYHQILEKDPMSFDALHSYAQFLKNKEGRLFEAQECYQRALAIRPDDVEALCSYGVLLTEAAVQDPKAFVRAQACFQHALTIQPRNPDILYSYAVLLCAWHRSDAHVKPSTSNKDPELESSGHSRASFRQNHRIDQTQAQAQTQAHRPALPPIKLEEPESPHIPQAPANPASDPKSAELEVSPWTKAVGGYLSEDADSATASSEARSGPVSPYRPSTTHERPAHLEPQIEMMAETRDSDNDEDDGNDDFEAEIAAAIHRTPKQTPPSTRGLAPAPARGQAGPLPARGRRGSLVNTNPTTPLVGWATRSNSSRGGAQLASADSRPSSATLAPVLSKRSPRPISPRQPTKPAAPQRAGSIKLRRTISTPEPEQRPWSGGERRPGVVESEALFRKVLDQRPEDPDALCSYAIFVHKVRAAKSLAALGSGVHQSALQEAEKLYRRALKADPKHELAALGRQEVREELKSTRK